VLFGGGAFGGTTAETWEFEGSAWRQIATIAAPPPRRAHALAFDTARGRVVLFGGRGHGFDAPPEEDTWEYDGVTWRQVQAAIRPPGRFHHALAYDTARSRAVLFGGAGVAGPFIQPRADTWEYDGSAWVPIPTVVAPPARSGHALAYDAARDRTVLFAGENSGQLFADTWEYDGVAWTAVATASSPPARHFHALAYDAARGRTVLFGGELRDDTWEYDGVDWTQLAMPSRPPRRSEHALAYDAGRGRLVLFGGYRGDRYGDTWELLPPAVPTWTRHGLGCAGSAGVPSLDAGPNPPTLGSTFPLRLSALPVGPNLVYLAFGVGIDRWYGRALPVELGAFGLPGCKLWIDPGTGILLAHSGTSTTCVLGIPNEPSLAGHMAVIQALVFDAAAGNGIGAVSNAGVIRLY
jgi:hypothetical protein